MYIMPCTSLLAFSHDVLANTMRNTLRNNETLRNGAPGAHVARRHLAIKKRISFALVGRPMALQCLRFNDCYHILIAPAAGTQSFRMRACRCCQHKPNTELHSLQHLNFKLEV